MTVTGLLFQPRHVTLHWVGRAGRDQAKPRPSLAGLSGCWFTAVRLPWREGPNIPAANRLLERRQGAATGAGWQELPGRNSLAFLCSTSPQKEPGSPVLSIWLQPGQGAGSVARRAAALRDAAADGCQAVAAGASCAVVGEARASDRGNNACVASVVRRGCCGVDAGCTAEQHGGRAGYGWRWARSGMAAPAHVPALLSHCGLITGQAQHTVRWLQHGLRVLQLLLDGTALQLHSLLRVEGLRLRCDEVGGQRVGWIAAVAPQQELGAAADADAD